MGFNKQFIFKKFICFSLPTRPIDYYQLPPHTQDWKISIFVKFVSMKIIFSFDFCMIMLFIEKGEASRLFSS